MQVKISFPFLVQIVDLVPYDSGTQPIVKRTNKGEFLVNTGTFGIIAIASGISQVLNLSSVVDLSLIVFSQPPLLVSRTEELLLRKRL